MSGLNDNTNKVEVQQSTHLTTETKTPEHKVLSYIKQPKTQERIENDIKSRLTNISYTLEKKKWRQDCINKITSYIKDAVKTISLLEGTQKVVEFESNIAELISEEINNVKLNYAVKYKNKKCSDINVILETVEIYFLDCIETKINKLQNKQKPDPVEFLRIAKLVNLLKNSFDLSLADITTVRYKMNSFLADKQYISRVKSSFDKKKIDNFCNCFHENYANKENIFKKLVINYNALLESKKNDLTLNTEDNLTRTNKQLAINDLTIAVDTMYFFASSKKHFKICDDFRIETSLFLEKITINDTLKVINEKFDKFNINGKTLVINYAEVNDTIESLVNTIKNIKVSKENKKFINTILYSHLFNKIDDHFNKIVDCENLNTKIKTSVLIHIINKCNSLGITKSKKCKLIKNLMKHNKSGYNADFSNSLKELVPAFDFELFIKDVTDTSTQKYSDKLVELLKTQSNQHTGIVLESFNYSELLDILNFEITDIQNLIKQDSEPSDKFSLDDIHQILSSKEAKKNIIKQEECLVKSALFFENILHKSFTLPENKIYFLSVLDYSLDDNTTCLENFFNSLFEAGKQSDLFQEIAQDEKIFELYKLVSIEMFHKKIDIVLNDLVHNETIDASIRLKYINSIDNALKNVFNEKYYLQRNEIIKQIQNTQLATVNLNNTALEDIQKNTVIMQFYTKFNQLIHAVTEDTLEKCNDKEIEQTIKAINLIYTNQTIKFFRSRNKAEQDLEKAISSYKKTVDTAIAEITQLTANNAMNFKKLVAENNKVAKSVESALNQFNNHYLKIAQLNDRAIKIKAKNSFFMALQLLLNSLCLFFEIIKYTVFTSTEIESSRSRQLYQEINNKVHSYHEQSINLSFMDKYFSNIKQHKANNEIGITNFKGIAYLFLNHIKDSIIHKVDNKTAKSIDNVASFINTDGTNMNVFSRLALLNLAVDQLLTEGNNSFTEIDLIKIYYQLVSNFNGAAKQPDFLKNDQLLKFNRYHSPRVSDHTQTLKQSVNQLKWVASKALASVASIENQDQYKYTQNNFSSFTIDFNYSTATDFVSLLGKEADIIFTEKHQENIFLMKNILAAISPYLRSENNLLLLNASLNKLISINTQYNTAKLTLDLNNVLKNITADDIRLSFEEITDTANHLSRLVALL